MKILKLSLCFLALCSALCCGAQSTNSTGVDQRSFVLISIPPGGLSNQASAFEAVAMLPDKTVRVSAINSSAAQRKLITLLKGELTEKMKLLSLEAYHPEMPAFSTNYPVVISNLVVSIKTVDETLSHY